MQSAAGDDRRKYAMDHAFLGPGFSDDEIETSAGLDGAEFVTANCFVPRGALCALGGFDEAFETAFRVDSDLQFTLLEWGVSLRQRAKIAFDVLLYKKHPVLYRQRICRRPLTRYYSAGACLLAAAVASALIPPLSLFWRIVGLFKFRTWMG